jgi:hypothetical protein
VRLAESRYGHYQFAELHDLRTSHGFALPEIDESQRSVAHQPNVARMAVGVEMAGVEDLVRVHTQQLLHDGTAANHNHTTAQSLIRRQV